MSLETTVDQKQMIRLMRPGIVMAYGGADSVCNTIIFFLFFFKPWKLVRVRDGQVGGADLVIFVMLDTPRFHSTIGPTSFFFPFENLNYLLILLVDGIAGRLGNKVGRGKTGLIDTCMSDHLNV